jgi:tetratricopeptide (TPR) repeat protein
MSHTLNLVTGLLAAARNFQTAGRSGAALDLLKRLALFRQLAPEIAEEIHSRLAELYATLEQYRDARRHLTIALTFRPQHADYHHRMARCIEADSEAAPDRARQYYRQAVRSAPENAKYWADYGAHLLEANRVRSGRAALRRAFGLSSHEPDLVGRIAAELRVAGLWNEARRLIRRARFQHGRDRRFAALWQQHQFEELCATQPGEPETSVRTSQRPVILPFLRAAEPAPRLRVGGKVVRLDSADTSANVLPLPKRQPRNPGNRQTK